MKEAIPKKTRRPTTPRRQAPATGALQRELKQKTPFASLRAEAFLGLLHTADTLQRQLRTALRPYGITETQYNALRILRGAGGQPMTCSAIGERLVSQDPDITRLLDRLERQGLVRRQRDLRDRRIVLSQITAEGLAQLKKLDGIVESSVERMLEHMDTRQLRSLIVLLEMARAPIGN
jgi:DNA-binding MarR family transcriptional regulator